MIYFHRQTNMQRNTTWIKKGKEETISNVQDVSKQSKHGKHVPLPAARMFWKSGPIMNET